MKGRHGRKGSQEKSKYERETKTLMQRVEKKERERKKRERKKDENDPIISLRGRDRYIRDVFKKSDKKRKRRVAVSSDGLRRRKRARVVGTKRLV